MNTLPSSLRWRGHSLPELLVGMMVGALALAGSLTALARARASWNAAAVENRLHERAQYAFATLEADIQMAGYFAGALPAALPGPAIPVVASTCGVGLLSRLPLGVESSDAAFPLACAAQGQGHRPGTDVLMVRRAAARLAVPAAGRAQWIACADDSCASRLDWNLPPDTAAAPPRSERRDLIIRAFYVSRGADGDPRTPALRVKSLSAISGAPAFIDTEVMPGVDDLQITLQPDAPEPHTVQVTLGVQSDAADQRTGEPLRRLSVTREFALRNRPQAPT